MSNNNVSSKKQRTEQRIVQAKKRKVWKQTLLIATSGFIITAIIFLLYVNQKNLPGERVEVMEDQSHIPEITSPHTPYNSDPPTSGPHIQSIAPWGVHNEPLPKELLVHNLEDGGVVIYYNDTVEQDVITQLEDVVKGYADRVVINPYPEMKEPIVLTAWGRIDRLDAFDEERVKEFIDAFRGIDHHK
jgi:hypothetical protein